MHKQNYNKNNLQFIGRILFQHKDRYWSEIYRISNNVSVFYFLRRKITKSVEI